MGLESWPFDRNEPRTVCDTRSFGLCSSLGGSEQEAMEKIKRPVRVLAAGSMIYAQNEAARDYHLLLDGWAERSVIVDSGGRLILDFALGGSFLGFQANLVGAHDHSAKCVTAVRICTLQGPQLNLLLSSSGQLAVMLARQLATDMTRVQEYMTNIGLRAARERIAHLLLELFCRTRHRLPIRPGDSIRFPLTQGHIGEAVALTSVYVSRTLRILREQGILQIVDGRLIILDPPALLQAAGIEGNGRTTGNDRDDVDTSELRRLPKVWMDTEREYRAVLASV